jgi:hypothetical protein
MHAKYFRIFYAFYSNNLKNCFFFQNKIQKILNDRLKFALWVKKGENENEDNLFKVNYI